MSEVVDVASRFAERRAWNPDGTPPRGEWEPQP